MLNLSLIGLLALFISSWQVDCTCKEIPLWGNVRVVQANADLKVQIVNSLQDLSVDTTRLKPSRCGEWRMVTFGEDFTVQFVDALPDISIKFVRGLPGMNYSSSSINN